MTNTSGSMPTASLKQVQAHLPTSVIGTYMPPPEVFQGAEQVERELAEHEMVVICGGLGGVMESACEAAKSVEVSLVSRWHDWGHGSCPREMT